MPVFVFSLWLARPVMSNFAFSVGSSYAGIRFQSLLHRPLIRRRLNRICLNRNRHNLSRLDCSRHIRISHNCNRHRPSCPVICRCHWLSESLFRRCLRLFRLVFVLTVGSQSTYFVVRLHSRRASVICGILPTYLLPFLTKDL